jgi:hypothetical protein
VSERTAGALAAVLFACNAHTPEWRVAEIHEEIAATNGASRNAAVKRALDANHATVANAKAVSVFFRSEMNHCVDAEVVVETSDKEVFVAPCNPLRNALFGGDAVQVKTEDGSSSRMLVASRPLAGDSSGGFVLANGANGELLLIRLRLNVVRKRKIHQQGTCNFMPSPVHLPNSASMFVVPVAPVRTLDVSYDGEDTEVTCDERVE